MRITKRAIATLSVAAAFAGAAGIGSVAEAAVPASAPAATPAYAHPYWPVDCSAVNVRKSYSTSSTIVGVAYRGDIDHISKGLYEKAKGGYTWWDGTITRKSDGRKVTGWVIASCINDRV